MSETADTEALATPNEEMKVQIQLTKIEDYTVEPGLLRLPVKKLTTAKNSEQMAFILDHPFRDEADFRFYMPKPTYWTDDFRFVEIMEAYGYTPGSIYQVQTDRLYVRKDDEDEEWEIVKPPTEPTRTDKLKSPVKRWMSTLNRVQASNLALLVVVVQGTMIGYLASPTIWATPVAFVVAFLLGLIVIPPPGN